MNFLKGVTYVFVTRLVLIQTLDLKVCDKRDSINFSISFKPGKENFLKGVTYVFVTRLVLIQTLCLKVCDWPVLDSAAHLCSNALAQLLS